MTDEQIERVNALTEAMARENEQAARETVIEQFGPHYDGVALITKHGGYQSKVIKRDCDPTIAVFRELLTNAVLVHARRLPKHQEFAELTKEVAA